MAGVQAKFLVGVSVVAQVNSLAGAHKSGGAAGGKQLRLQGGGLWARCACAHRHQCGQGLATLHGLAEFEVQRGHCAVKGGGDHSALAGGVFAHFLLQAGAAALDLAQVGLELGAQGTAFALQCLQVVLQGQTGTLQAL